MARGNFGRSKQHAEAGRKGGLARGKKRKQQSAEQTNDQQSTMGNTDQFGEYQDFEDM
ncbi:MAG TPA: hypothetical protein VLF68_03680 [Candidatus Saccharimonadales bacterium]|nr:hypothetical protein [Candidatus Saccharimonadales bacterium]